MCLGRMRIDIRGDLRTGLSRTPCNRSYSFLAIDTVFWGKFACVQPRVVRLSERSDDTRGV